MHYLAFNLKFIKMKKYLVFLIFIIIQVGCKKSSSNMKDANTTIEKFTVYKYKVVGLNDSIISDSIWKMIFKIEGIDELVIDKVDSLVTVKINKTNVDEKRISDEIQLRGGKIIEQIKYK
jgi:ethanolamine transporter EutH